jgi:hypothetical protein
MAIRERNEDVLREAKATGAVAEELRADTGALAGTIEDLRRSLVQPRSTSTDEVDRGWARGMRRRCRRSSCATAGAGRWSCATSASAACGSGGAGELRVDQPVRLAIGGEAPLEGVVRSVTGDRGRHRGADRRGDAGSARLGRLAASSRPTVPQRRPARKRPPSSA